MSGPARLRLRAGATELSPANALAAALAGCVWLSFVVAVLAKTGEVPAVLVVADVTGIALPIAFGVLRLTHVRDDRFAWLLVGEGFLWSLTTLCQSTDATLYSVGRVAGWAFVLSIVYLLLAFPSGRLTTRRDRWIVGVGVGVVAGLYLPSALFAEFPVPFPMAGCGTDCPANAFAIGGGPGAFAQHVILPVREVITVGIYAMVAASVLDRARGGIIARRTLGPVAVAAAISMSALIVFMGARAADAAGTGAHTAGLLFVFLLPVVTLLFGLGLVLERLFVASVLLDLARHLGPYVRAAELRRVMARALRDPDLDIVYRMDRGPGRWIDENGWPVQTPAARAGRSVTEVHSGGRVRGAIVHDADLSQQRELMDSACAYALTAVENERLARELDTSLRELSASRARVISVADRDRKKIARDVHDGAQQRLVALRAKLELVAERAEIDSPSLVDPIRALEHEADLTIDEVRGFARGVYPQLLSKLGLSDALRAAGRAAAVSTIVDAARLPRYAPAVEATVYFACLEAIQNAAKHAEGLTGVAVTVEERDGLRFAVRDDGAGFDPGRVDEGAGVTNMRDRLAAIGGRLEVESSPGHGTTVRGIIPEVDRRPAARPSWWRS